MLVLLLVAAFASERVWSLPLVDEHFTVHKHSAPHHSRLLVENCDDAEHGIGIDWNGNDTYVDERLYRCMPDEKHTVELNMLRRNRTMFSHEICKPSKARSVHFCLRDKIIYDRDELVPMGGPHRPVWIVYGEYFYIPPQRWIHALEHGAAVFLYDPCANETEIAAFKKLARSCLRRHVIAPFKHMPPGEMFNVVTYGCRIGLDTIIGQELIIVNYLKRHAIQDGPEFHIVEDGHYSFGLVQQANVISDLKDSKICPNYKKN